MASVRSSSRRDQKTARTKRNSKTAAAEIVSPARSWRELDRPASELLDLRIGLIYWLYGRKDAVRSRLYADLIESLLRDLPRGSIAEEECRSLIAEARGDLRKAIQHRKREIE